MTRSFPHPSTLKALLILERAEQKERFNLAMALFERGLVPRPRDQQNSLPARQDALALAVAWLKRTNSKWVREEEKIRREYNMGPLDNEKRAALDRAVAVCAIADWDALEQVRSEVRRRLNVKARTRGLRYRTTYTKR